MVAAVHARPSVGGRSQTIDRIGSPANARVHLPPVIMRARCAGPLPCPDIFAGASKAIDLPWMIPDNEVLAVALEIERVDDPAAARAQSKLGGALKSLTPKTAVQHTQTKIFPRKATDFGI